MDKSVVPDSDDWGDHPGISGMATGAKLGIFITMILLAAFGLLVYRNVDLHQKHLLAGEASDQNKSSKFNDSDQGSAATAVIEGDHNASAAPVSFLDTVQETFRAETADFSFEASSSQAPESTENEVAEWTQFADQNSFEPARVGKQIEVVDPFTSRPEVADESLVSDRLNGRKLQQLAAIAEAEVEEQSIPSDNGTAVDDKHDYRSVARQNSSRDVLRETDIVNKSSEFRFDDTEGIERSTTPVLEHQGNLVQAADRVSPQTAKSGVEQGGLQPDAFEHPPLIGERDLTARDDQDVVFGSDTHFSNSGGRLDSAVPDSDPELPTGTLDIEIQENSDGQIDTAGTRPGQLLDKPGPASRDEDWDSSNPVFAAENNNSLVEDGSEETAVLRPLTGSAKLQIPFEFSPPDSAEFSMSEYAYENHIITASAESEPCDVCEVRSGDNYWKISHRIYGTTRYFSALALHNKKRIPDPKKLRPGMKVLLPSAEYLEEKYPSLFRDAAPREFGPGGYFIRPDGTAAYRIGERDTLSEIARKHLGRSSRWIQIYRLNRNLLSNPNRLKPGTVISLPDNATDVHMVP